MTASLNFVNPNRTDKHKIIREQLNVVESHIERIERRFNKLEKMYRINTDRKIRKELYKYVAKQDMLLKIAQNLRTKFKSLKPTRILNAVKKNINYDLDQLLIELDLLEEMNFRLKKSYFVFIKKYGAKIISENIITS